MRSFMIALGMGILLFIYGYILSMAGHDHSKHSDTIRQHGPVIQDTGGDTSRQGSDRSHHH